MPVVSFDCPSGPREIIRHDTDGLLVSNGDVPALASALDWLMMDGETRQRFSARGPEVVDRLATEEVMA